MILERKVIPPTQEQIDRTNKIMGMALIEVTSRDTIIRTPLKIADEKPNSTNISR